MKIVPKAEAHRRDHEGDTDGDARDMRQRAAEAVGEPRRQQHDVVRPRREEHHGGEHDKGDQKRLRHVATQAIFGRACGRFDSSMMAMPPTTVSIPASRSGPKVSPNTTLDAAAPTNGTSSANGTTCAAV